MRLHEIYQQIIQDFKNSSLLEYAAIISGIASVWFSRIENILVYPVGLISTIGYVYISFNNHLFGEATVNLYYTAMSIYGWAMWAKRDLQNEHVVRITYSSAREWKQQLLFFAAFYTAVFIALTFLKRSFYPETIPAGDAFATATAFTGMWLMARKKVESWYWWLATNIASVPLYFVKHLPLTSLYYIILLVMAVFGLIEWKKRAKETHA